MPETGRPPLGALERDRFFGRIEETRRLRASVRALLRGWGRSVTIAAPPGIGKTELLKQWYGTLFREGEVVPFFHAFPGPGLEQRFLAADFLRGFASQCLAFRRRDPAVLGRALPTATLLEAVSAAWGEGGALIAAALRSVEALPPGAPVLFEAVSVPHRFAEVTGRTVLSLLDDLAAPCAAVAGGGPPWPREAVASRVAPAVFAGEDEASLELLLGPGRAAAATAWRIGPLTDEAAGQLLQHLLRTAGIEISGETRDLAVRLAGGSPFALQALVRAMGEIPSSGTIELAQAYAACVCDGELARYWGGRLAAAVPDRRVRSIAVEVLAFALRARPGSLEAGRLAVQMFKSERDVAEAVEALERRGFLQVDCARVAAERDPVLGDFVAALYRREFGQAGSEAVAAALAAEKIRGRRAAALQVEREQVRSTLKAVFAAWRGQRVPAVLFDAAALERRFPGIRAGAAPDALSSEQETVTLPTVVSVASGRVGEAASLDGLELDAVAWAWRGEPGEAGGEVVWVARRMRGGEGSEAEIEAFDGAVSALQAAGDLPATRLVRWAVLDAPLDAGGERAASERRLSTSTLRQVAALGAVLGVAVSVPAGAAPRRPAELELEMTIPPAADAELVAARALEQLAENLRLAPEEVGRVKMALVEACINAFEHSGVREGRVRLVFEVGGGDLRIRVENRGRTVGGLPAPAAVAAGAGAPLRRRGWGLTLIRELMDEVVLEPREDGVSLLMVKHLRAGGESGG